MALPARKHDNHATARITTKNASVRHEHKTMAAARNNHERAQTSDGDGITVRPNEGVGELNKSASAEKESDSEKCGTTFATNRTESSILIQQNLNMIGNRGKKN